MKREFKNFGALMRKLRLETGYTQESLGKKIKTHRQFISNVERGECAYPFKVLKRFIALAPQNHLKALIWEAMMKDAEIVIAQHIQDLF